MDCPSLTRWLAVDRQPEAGARTRLVHPGLFVVELSSKSSYLVTHEEDSSNQPPNEVAQHRSTWDTPQSVPDYFQDKIFRRAIRHAVIDHSVEIQTRERAGSDDHRCPSRSLPVEQKHLTKPNGGKE